MGWLQAGLQGAGRAGNELEGARTGLRDERTKGSFDRLQMIQMALGLMQLQKQIQQMGLPQFEGTVGTPGGGTGVLNRDPGTGKTSMDSLVPGLDKGTVSARIRSMGGKTSSKEYEQVADAVDQGLIDPQEGMKRGVQMMERESEKKLQTPKSWSAIRGVGGLFAGVKSPDGTEYFSEETIPDEQGKALFRSMKETEEKYLAHQQKMELLARAREKGQDASRLLSAFAKAKTMLKPIDRIVDTSQRAQAYVKNPTGPGDVALMLAFVEATKPETGFRFTDAERKMIATSRGFVEGAQARVQSGFTGILFGDDQRAIIGNIVKKAGVRAKERKGLLIKQFSQLSPDLGDVLQMTGDGEVPEELQDNDSAPPPGFVLDNP